MFVAPVTSTVTPTAYLSSPTKVMTASSESDFGTSLASTIDSVQAMQANTERLGVQALSGDLTDVHNFTIAATKSAVALELTAAVRNRAVDAFSEIMRMQA